MQLLILLLVFIINFMLQGLKPVTEVSLKKEPDSLKTVFFFSIS